MCDEFTAKSTSKKITKTGQHLLKSEARTEWHFFPGTVYANINLYKVGKTCTFDASHRHSPWRQKEMVFTKNVQKVHEIKDTDAVFMQL